MAFQIPIGRVQRLPDSVEVRMPRNSCRTIQLLRLSDARGEQYCGRRHDCEYESIAQRMAPLPIESLSGRHATEVGFLIDTALAGVSRHLRVRTQRARSHHLFVHHPA